MSSFGTRRCNSDRVSGHAARGLERCARFVVDGHAMARRRLQEGLDGPDGRDTASKPAEGAAAQATVILIRSTPPEAGRVAANVP